MRIHELGLLPPPMTVRTPSRPFQMQPPGETVYQCDRMQSCWLSMEDNSIHSWFWVWTMCSATMDDHRAE